MLQCVERAEEGRGMDGLEQAQKLDVESVARTVDRALHQHRRGVITAAEAKESIQGSTSLYMRFAVAPADEIELAVGYARQAVEELALRPDVMDPVLIEHFDEWLRGQRMADEVQQRLDALLDPLVEWAAKGDADATEELAELCRSGRQTHRLILSLNTAAAQILRGVHRAGCWAGLRDAVSPRHAGRGQLASRHSNGQEFILAMNLLGHLAADAEHGAPARSALLDLADHVELAGEAIVRLPLHLLDDDDRARLVEIHERRVGMFCDDPLFIPLSIELLRDNRLVRGAVWQAFDARHLN